MRWLVLVLGMLLPLAAGAATLTEQDKAEVERLRAYLNNLETLEATFEQFSDSGASATGRFWLHRPNRLRFEYDPPNPILIIARASFLIHFDMELKEANYFDQEDTPAWFLLADEVQLGGNVNVLAVQYDGPLVAVTAQERGKEDSGAITLVFDRDPIRLRGWRLIDPGGNHVRLALIDQKVGEPIDPDLFEFRPTDYE